MIPYRALTKIVCILCAQQHETKQPICERCQALLIPLINPCKQCATPTPPELLQDHRCRFCITNPPPLDAIFAPYRFEDPLRTLLHEFKYHDKIFLAPFLANLMTNCLPSSIRSKTCLVPVPSYRKRIHERGYNQSAILCQYLSKKTKFPYLMNQIKKIKHTPPQAGLDKKTRQQNLKNAFQCRHIPYTHVILVDDLVTTGSTANEIAITLKQSGVSSVSLWCVAKTCFEV